MSSLVRRLRRDGSDWCSEAADKIEHQGKEVERMRAALLNILAKAESGFTFNHANLATQCRRALGDDG